MDLFYWKGERVYSTKWPSYIWICCSIATCTCWDKRLSYTLLTSILFWLNLIWRSGWFDHASFLSVRWYCQHVLSHGNQWTGWVKINCNMYRKRSSKYVFKKEDKRLWSLPKCLISVSYRAVEGSDGHHSILRTQNQCRGMRNNYTQN